MKADSTNPAIRQKAWGGDYLDTYFGVFDGNILPSLRDLFPTHLQHHFDGLPPVDARWERMERRVLSRGSTGYFFSVPQEESAAWRRAGFPEPRPYDDAGYSTLLRLFETIYAGFPHDPDYPGRFNGEHDSAFPFVSIEETRLVIWHQPSSGPEHRNSYIRPLWRRILFFWER